MQIINLEDFRKNSLYNDFSLKNPDIGYLTVESFTAYEGMPVSDTDIVIVKDIGDYRVVFFKGKTNSSGIINNIPLPAPLTVGTNEPNKIPEYTSYDMVAIHEGYETIKRYAIGMFGGVDIIQYVKMIPEKEEIIENGD